MKIKLLLIATAFFMSIFCQETVEKKDATQESKTESKQESKEKACRTITFESKDKLTVTADIYLTKNESAPFILLYHQAGFSRGEYREIAPKLNMLGFNCMAIDQRSGKEVNGIENQTFIEAKKQQLPTQYTDAFPDLQAAFEYATEIYKAEKFIIWGSSYSAALSFIMGSKYADKIDRILAFSPGEYFTFEEKSIPEFAADVKCPVFITSAKNEQQKWQGIFDAITHENKTFYLPEAEGYHGSRALWEKHDGHEKVWKAVEEFLVK